jgi:hypothetical protein
VVDAEGRAIGMLSALDLLRGMTGTPARHPASFPGYDEDLDVYWSSEDRFDLDHLDLAPNASGVFVLVAGGPNQRDAIVWAESADNVLHRLHELIAAPLHVEPEALRRVLAFHYLRFRAAALADSARREHVVRTLRAQYEHLPPPQARAIAPA